MFFNGTDDGSDRYVKLDKELARATDKIVESVYRREHKSFHYWNRVLEILCKKPELLWVESKEDFITKNIDKPDPFDSAVMTLLYKSLE